MKTVFKLGALLSMLLLGACSINNKGLNVGERQLLDVRHDHLRCEVKLDRLRDLYQIPLEEEPGGLMDGSLVAGGDTTDGSFDAPLTGGHDAPLTGGHDAPLTGGHDAPLTGGHDHVGDMRQATLESADACWDSVALLVNRYNECVVTFLQCRADNDPDCLIKYEACLLSKRP